MLAPSETAKRLAKVSKAALRDLCVGALIGALVLWFLPSWIRWSFMILVSLLLLASVFGAFYATLKPRKKVHGVGKAVLITGCDSGFGHMLAARLDDLGFHVFAGCLFPDGDGAQKLKKAASNRLHIIGMDVTKSDDIQKAVEYVKEQLKGREFWALVCNAGINDGAELLWTDMDIIRRVMDINLYGVVCITKAFLPLIIKSKGRVVVVASCSGRHTFPNLGPYCMSKHGVIAFCESLRLEMYKFGVQVVTIDPWMHRTPILNEDNIKRYVRRTWDLAPEDIKSLHPPDYMEWYPDSIVRFMNDSVSENLNEPVECLEEAVTAVNPRYSYSPGPKFTRVLFWFVTKLPREMYDFVALLPMLK